MHANVGFLQSILSPQDVAISTINSYKANVLHGKYSCWTDTVLFKSHFNIDKIKSPQLCNDSHFIATLLPGEALLTPTKIYSRLLLPILRSGAVKAYAHITGGGLLENIPRVLPQELAVDIGNKHDTPPILELFRLPC